MPFSHGRLAVFTLEDTAAASYGVSPDLTSIAHSWTRDNPLTTTMGKDTNTRIAGIRDYSISLAYIWNGDAGSASALPQILDALLAASGVTQIRYAPGGSISGCPLYTACMLVSQHDHTAPVNGVVAGTGTLQIASGSLTTGSCI